MKTIYLNKIEFRYDNIEELKEQLKEKEIIVGKGSTIGDYTSLANKISIGNNVTVGSYCSIGNNTVLQTNSKLGNRSSIGNIVC